MSYYIEGAARILNKPNVFINPSQVINRDLSILVIQTFINANNKQNYSLLEPLSATGIRGIRYY